MGRYWRVFCLIIVLVGLCSTVSGRLFVPDDGWIGSDSEPNAIQIDVTGNVFMPQDFTVGSTAFDVDTVNNTVGIGSAAAATALLRSNPIVTNVTDSQFGINFRPTYEVGAVALDFTSFAFLQSIQTKGNNAGDIIGASLGLDVFENMGVTVTIDNVFALDSVMDFRVQNRNSVISVTEARHINLHDPTLPGASDVATLIAFFTEEMTVGDTNWQFFSEGGASVFKGTDGIYLGQEDGAERIVSDADGTLDLYAGTSVDIHDNLIVDDTATITGITRANGGVGVGINSTPNIPLNVEATVAGGFALFIHNLSSDAAAFANVRALSGTADINLLAHSSTRTVERWGGPIADTCELLAVGAPLCIGTLDANQSLLLGTEGELAMTIDGSDQKVTIEKEFLANLAGTVLGTFTANSDVFLGNLVTDTITIKGITTIGDGGFSAFTGISATGVITQSGFATATFGDVNAAALNIGTGVPTVDYQFSFIGENSTGVITWMEDEDYFDFADTVKTSAGRIKNTTRYTTTQAIPVTDSRVFANTDGGAWTATLPPGAEGQALKITNTGSSGNLLTVAPNGAEHLIGVNSNWILFDGETLVLTFNATDGWY